MILDVVLFRRSFEIVSNSDEKSIKSGNVSSNLP